MTATNIHTVTINFLFVSILVLITPHINITNQTTHFRVWSGKLMFINVLFQDLLKYRRNTHKYRISGNFRSSRDHFYITKYLNTEIIFGIVCYKKRLKSPKNDRCTLKKFHIFPIFANLWHAKRKPRIYGVMLDFKHL